MTEQSYKLKPTSPGSGIPAAWRTRPSGEHPEGQIVTASEAGTFDLDEHFPPGTEGRDWFEVVEAARPGAGHAAATTGGPPATATATTTPSSGSKRPGRATTPPG